MRKFNWGIIGLGNIAHQFAQDLSIVKHANLYAVASRSKDKANDFAKHYQATVSYGSYDDLLKDEAVEVVYIATPNVFHKSHTIDVLKSGKAVLCEKPFAMNTAEVESMIETAKAEGKFLMEALWTNFMPTVEKLSEFNQHQTYGSIKHLKAEFCFKAPYNPEERLFNPKLGGGALLDIGIYPVYLALKLLGQPNQISAESKLTETGVDLETEIIFKYDDGVTANLFCSFDKNTPSEAFITYENAEVKLHSRFHQTDKLSAQQIDNKQVLDFDYQAKGYNFEIEHVHECLSKNRIESPLMPFDFSMLLIKTLDDIRHKIGLHF